MVFAIRITTGAFFWLHGLVYLRSLDTPFQSSFDCEFSNEPNVICMIRV
ncbi:MAG: hypothetical protein ACTHMC_01520 [Pseudobacter sp.]